MNLIAQKEAYKLAERNYIFQLEDHSEYPMIQVYKKILKPLNLNLKMKDDITFSDISVAGFRFKTEINVYKKEIKLSFSKNKKGYTSVELNISVYERKKEFHLRGFGWENGIEEERMENFQKAQETLIKISKSIDFDVTLQIYKEYLNSIEQLSALEKEKNKKEKEYYNYKNQSSIEAKEKIFKNITKKEVQQFVDDLIENKIEETTVVLIEEDKNDIVLNETKIKINYGKRKSFYLGFMSMSRKDLEKELLKIAYMKNKIIQSMNEINFLCDGDYTSGIRLTMEELKEKLKPIISIKEF